MFTSPSRTLAMAFDEAAKLTENMDLSRGKRVPTEENHMVIEANAFFLLCPEQ